MPRPIGYIKAHPLATTITFAAGMVIGPWLMGFVGRTTGVNVSLPTVGD
jgi:hypothetical protein